MNDKIRLDPDGQPPFGFNQSRRLNRAVHELIGFLRGIVADEYINPAESASLASWLCSNTEISDMWPVCTLLERLNRIYADGIADEEERTDLRELVEKIVGSADPVGALAPTDLPLTCPAPDVIFDSNEFVFTGRFIYGTRKVCQAEVHIRGGTCADAIRLRTSYLVIGSVISPDWRYSSYGNKIQKAVEYSALTDRCCLTIISEQHWESFLLPSAKGHAA